VARIVAFFAVVGFCAIAISCSSAPQPPKPGTPAFIWGAARTTYASGDFLKASDNLSQIAKSENEFAVRSQPILLVLECGIAQGYTDLAENFENGARANRANPMPFRKQATLFRNYASAAAIQTAETTQKFLAGAKTDAVAFEFGYPSGSASEPVQLQRVAKGMIVPDAEIEHLQKAMVQRGVLQAVTRATGSGNDVAKALDLFKTGDVKIPRAAFVLALAKALHEQAGLFGPKKFDQPLRVAMLCKQSEDAVKTIPESKETKDLLAQIAKTRKTSKVQ
jgi:hypothetical protein